MIVSAGRANADRTGPGQPTGGTVILGVGNVLLRDDGIGVLVVRALAGRAADPGFLPPAAEIVDGGTLGVELLPVIEGVRAVVVVDAVELGLPPGAVRTLRGAALRGVLGGHLSAHQVGLGDLLAVARLRGTLPERVSLVGVQPGTTDVGLELSDAVRAALPAAVEQTRAEAWSCAGM